jgi:hypothetical protein
VARDIARSRRKERRMRIILVVVQAGQLLFDTETGELLKFTPNITPGFADVICPALGGAPAP